MDHLPGRPKQQVSRLNELARERGQTLAQMSLAWVLRYAEVPSAIIGASRVSHVDDAVKTLGNLDLTQSELQRIDAILRS